MPKHLHDMRSVIIKLLMAKARYLEYPDFMTLMASGASRKQVEKALVSYSYVMLCRHALQELLKERLADPSILFSLGDDLGAQQLAGLFIYMKLPMFSEPSSLNGPIKELADRESEAFEQWVKRTQGFEWPNDATALVKMADRITSLCRQWVGDFTASAPRSLWFVGSIQSVDRIELRRDLRDWTFNPESTKKGSSAEADKPVGTKEKERQKTTTSIPQDSVLSADPGGSKEPFEQYRISAEQGNAIGQMYLADCYVSGNGVIKDEVEAYAYYNLAGISIPDAKVQLAKLEAKLSRAEISAGQVRSRELLLLIKNRNSKH